MQGFNLAFFYNNGEKIRIMLKNNPLTILTWVSSICISLHFDNVSIKFCFTSKIFFDLYNKVPFSKCRYSER